MHCFFMDALFGLSEDLLFMSQLIAVWKLILLNACYSIVLML